MWVRAMRPPGLTTLRTLSSTSIGSAQWSSALSAYATSKLSSPRCSAISSPPQATGTTGASMPASRRIRA